MKTVNKRMKEIKKHLSKWKEYDHVVINDDLKLCYKKIMNIIRSKKKQLYNQSFIKKHINKLII